MKRMHQPALVSFLLVSLVSLVDGEPPGASQPRVWEEFSGEKALAHVRQLVDFGPRPPGSEAIEKSRDYIENQLRLSGWQVTRQAFTDDTPRGKVRFVNLIARFPTQQSSAPSFLLCSHYDTKTFDSFRFVGANDGGSSTGLLLELSRVLGQHPILRQRLSWRFLTAKKRMNTFPRRTGSTEAVILPGSLETVEPNNFAVESCSTWWAIVL